MNSNAHPTLPSAAASTRAPASPSLELSAARQARDGLAILLRAERTAAADFLLALADFDRRRGWERLGYASLFSFLVAELSLSKGAAYVRFTAARLLQDFPEVVEPIREGKLRLSAVGELARVATTGNFATVLPRFFGCSSREAREVAAAILPREAPPTRDQVTRVAPVAQRPAPAQALAAQPWPAPRPPTVAASLNFERSTDSESVRAHEPVPIHPARDAAPRDDVEPLTADLRRLHVTVSRRLLAKIDAARDGLSHSIPGASTEQVLEAALDLLLEKQARARGQVKKPRTTLPTPPQTAPQPQIAPRTSPAACTTGEQQHEGALVPTEPPPHRRTGPREAIPAAVRRAVWERDGGRCAWPLDGGGCCGSTHRVQFDHVVPWARWGAPTVDKVRLLCARHNRAAAAAAFGPACVSRYAPPRS
jgi:hypothetical protein